MPWDNIPIGQILHQRGNLTMKEPARAPINIPFANVAFLFAKNFPKGHVGQANLDFFLFFSRFCFSRSSRLLFSFGMNLSIALSAPSTTVPTGQIQLQNIGPNNIIEPRKIDNAGMIHRVSISISVGLKHCLGDMPEVNKISRPPTGHIIQPPGPKQVQLCVKKLEK